MQFEKCIELMRELDALHIRIKSTDGKRIFDCLDESSVENTIAKLKSYLPVLKTFGRVNIIAGTESHKKQHFKDAFEWPVTFEGTNEVIPQNNQNNQQNQIKSGYISEREAMLMAKLEALTVQMSFQKQIDDLNAKIVGTTKEDKWEKLIDKYLPLAGALVTIDDAKLANMAKIAQIQGMSNGNGISGVMKQGTQTNTNSQTQQTSIALTEEEKKMVQDVNNEIDLLSEKLPLEKILYLIKGLNAKPEFADQAINFMKMTSQS